MTTYSFQKSYCDHSLLIKMKKRSIIDMVVYVDDVILIGDNEQ